MPWGPSTVRAELARLEEAGLLEHPHTSAGRVPTDSGYRFYVDELLESGDLPAVRAPLRAQRHAPRGGRGHARHHRAAVAGHEPAGARVGAADRDGHDPPRRGAAAPAAGGDGGGHHLHRRRDQARDLLRRAARPRAGGLGRPATSTRRSAAWTSGRRMLHAKLSPTRARRARARVPRTRSRRRSPSSRSSAGDTLFVDGAARLLSEHRFQELPQLSDLMDVLERRVALLVGAAGVAVGAQRLPAHRAREPGARAALAEHGGRQLRPGPAQPRRGQRARPGAAWTTRRAIIAVRQAAAELSRFVAEVYDE